MTTPALSDLSAAALAVLAREGRAVETGRHAAFTGEDGVEMRISCTGPDLPDAVPDEIEAPDRIAGRLGWVGRYRLVVNAPLIVFDLYWKPDEPVRVMTFSRGDWERALLARAGD